jgi:uncharacterized LabA/DUF88 family protein
MTTKRQLGTYVFIDGENLFKAYRKMGYKNVDYIKLYWWLKNKKNADKIFLYAGIIDGDVSQQNKFNGLDKLGYTVKTKPVQKYAGKVMEIDIKCPECGHEFVHQEHLDDRSKANCDAELTLDVTRAAIKKKFSELIVFSGDGDFSYLYEFVAKTYRKKVCVYSPLKYPAALVTSSKLKKLDKSGCISLYNLEAVAQHRSIPW